MDFKKIYNEGLVYLLIIFLIRLIKELKITNKKNQINDMDIL